MLKDDYPCIKICTKELKVTPSGSISVQHIKLLSTDISQSDVKHLEPVLHHDDKPVKIENANDHLHRSLHQWFEKQIETLDVQTALIEKTIGHTTTINLKFGSKPGAPSRPNIFTDFN
ncbi:hypothetical protein JOB18_032253 [Solea senegalensis]|uniref:Uncharacterized protein n=1 Tax=Solea senegalensis TaxID=28829 RepID=A0AAV6SKY4_SOLSE|nr:hypothetical protein JOB18_032253 [Solea senegalensis]